MPDCLITSGLVARMSLKRYPIRDWPEGERPRERLLAEGPRRLTTAELLGIVLRTGAQGRSAVDLARTLLQEWKSLADLEAAEPQVLAETKGMGPAKIAQVKAALELGRRLLAEVERAARPRITSSKDVVELMAPRLRGLQVERCEIILLNGGNEVGGAGDAQRGFPDRESRLSTRVPATGQSAPRGRSHPGTQPSLGSLAAQCRRPGAHGRVGSGRRPAPHSAGGSRDHRGARSLQFRRPRPDRGIQAPAPTPRMNWQERERAIGRSRDPPRRRPGEAASGLVVRGGILANVYTGELLEGWGVAVVGTRIASIGPEVERNVGPSTTVIDAQGRIIAPGFIDGHTHLDCIHRLDHYLSAAVPTGLTALITETSQLSTVGGYPALAAFLGHLPRLPITAFATAPTISYLLSDRGDGAPMITTEEMARLLEEPGVVGFGEVYWPALLEGRAGLRLLIAKAEAMGKGVEGHTAGARGNKLTACVAAGISSCHEPITAQEIQERLRLGLTTMVRDGSIRRDLGALEGALKGIVPRRLVLVSDTVWAHHLLERGYLDESARQAVRMGLEPMQALQAITLAPAEHFRIEGRVGGLAPDGRRTWCCSRNWRASAPAW